MTACQRIGRHHARTPHVGHLAMPFFGFCVYRVLIRACTPPAALAHAIPVFFFLNFSQATLMELDVVRDVPNI